VSPAARETSMIREFTRQEIGVDPDESLVFISEQSQPTAPAAPVELDAILSVAIEREASDVHLTPGYPPVLRVHGRLASLDEPPLTPDQVQQMVQPVVPRHLREQFDQGKNLDCSLPSTCNGELHRFRLNVYRAQGHWCACFRHIQSQVPTFGELGLSQELAAQLLQCTNGMIILTGVTGSGKSSTLAALVHHFREKGSYHILTIEEPIEFQHAPGGPSMVTQREVGRDVSTFAEGLKYGLRQDPDIILVGEIRDWETAQIALSAAETGHLILTTMHTRDAKGALTRFVDLFPYQAQEDVRKQLAMSLRWIITQYLLPPVEGERRVLALEALRINQQVQIAIRSGKIEAIDSAAQMGKRDGMITLDEDIQRLVKLGKISVETARCFVRDPDTIKVGARTW